MRAANQGTLGTPDTLVRRVLVTRVTLGIVEVRVTLEDLDLVDSAVLTALLENLALVVRQVFLVNQVGQVNPDSQEGPDGAAFRGVRDIQGGADYKDFRE